MPVITKPNQHFDVLTWSGTGGGSGATRSITGLNFQPDFVWEKARSSGSGHQLLDSVRGVGQNKVLASNSTSAEPNPANTESLYGWLSSLDSGGFTVTNGTSTFDNWNKSGDTYVGWTWKAGGTAVTNTNGSITSQVSVNTTAGFSIVTYTGNNTTSTVGHGLGVVPAMIITKSRSATSLTGWMTKHQSLASNYNVALNLTDAAWNPSSNGYVGDLNSSTTFQLVNGSVNGNNVNQSGVTYVAYCFAQVAGYSAFGSYTGNGSSDGPFIFTGFRPKFIMLKNSTSAASWSMLDTSRNTYNISNARLFAESSQVEDTSQDTMDILSNGFKLRTTGLGVNGSGSTIIYMAFAEAPFKYANAR